MTNERWQHLMSNDDENLTEQELADGYHFCLEWDGLLVGSDDPEMVAGICTCLPPDHKLYQAVNSK